MTATVDNLWKSPERLCITPGGGEVGGSLGEQLKRAPEGAVNTPEALAIGAVEEPLMTSHQSTEPVPNQGQSARTTLNLIRSVIGHADGHEVAAVSKIRAVLDAAGEAV